jgi:hypothetical protein
MRATKVPGRKALKSRPHRLEDLHAIAAGRSEDIAAIGISIF